MVCCAGVVTCCAAKSIAFRWPSFLASIARLSLSFMRSVHQFVRLLFWLGAVFNISERFSLWSAVLPLIAGNAWRWSGVLGRVSAADTKKGLCLLNTTSDECFENTRKIDQSSARPCPLSLAVLGNGQVCPHACLQRTLARGSVSWKEPEMDITKTLARLVRKFVQT